MVSLLDVNVLVALAWQTHIHHDAAHRWFARNSAAGWATCPVSEAGLFRLSLNGSVIGRPPQPGEALDVLRVMRALKGHRFWSNDISLSDTELIETNRLLGHRQVTDALLLAVARQNGGRLVTFDAAVSALLPEGASNALVVLKL